MVELSIVIVIIGLIIAGVTVGTSMVRDANIKNMINQVTKHKAAVNAFKLQYNGMPGDIKNSSSYWPSCDATPSNCNGNGDEKITRTGVSARNEFLRVWQQLAAARLIEGNYTGTGTTATPGTNVPKTSISGGGISLFYDDTGGVPLHKTIFSVGKVGTGTGLGETSGAILTAKETYSIDKKIDDGLPLQGNFLGSRGWSGSTYLNCRSSNTTYNVSLAGNSCNPVFLLN